MNQGLLARVIDPLMAERTAIEKAGAYQDRLVRHSKIGLGVMIAVLAAAATVIRVSGAVIAQGDVSVDTEVKRVAHPTGGVVSAIRVRNGTRVSTGQVIAELDAQTSGVAASLSKQSIVRLSAQMARLDAEALGRPAIAFPPGLKEDQHEAVAAAMADETRLFASRRREQAASVAQRNERIQQLEEEISGLDGQLRAIREQMVLIRPELESVRDLWRKKLVTIARLNQLERTSSDLKGAEGTLIAQIAQTRAKISETRSQIREVDQAAIRQAGQELAETRAQLNAQSIQDATTAERHQRNLILAPADGIVDKLSIATIGGVIRPFDTIAEIVPINDRLVVDVALSAADIDRVRVGQQSRILFTAFNAQTTPEVVGKVSWVSAEKSIDERSGASYFRARIMIDRKSLTAARIPKLSPGMPAEVYIQTGERTLLSYLTKPFRDQMERAFRQ